MLQADDAETVAAPTANLWALTEAEEDAETENDALLMTLTEAAIVEDAALVKAPNA
jgi:hypothetical protein